MDRGIAKRHMSVTVCHTCRQNVDLSNASEVAIHDVNGQTNVCYFRHIPFHIPEDVQTFVPSSGDTISPVQNKKYTLVAINSPVTLASLVVNFFTSPIPGQRFSFSTLNAIIQLTIGNGNFINSITSMSAGGYAGYTYDGTTWRRTT